MFTFGDGLEGLQSNVNAGVEPSAQQRAFQLSEELLRYAIGS